MNKLARIDKTVNTHDNYAIFTDDGVPGRTRTRTFELYHKEMWHHRVRDLDIYIQRRVTEVQFGGKAIPKITWDFTACNGSQHMSQQWGEEEASRMLTSLGLHVCCDITGPLEPCDIWAD